MIPITLNPIRIAVACAFIAITAFAGIQTVRLADTKTELAEEVADRAKATTALFKAVADAKDEIAKIQATHAAKQQESSDAYTKDKAKTEASKRAVVVERDSLRKQLSDYAAGSDLGAGTDATTCSHYRDRAATLGDLLGTADRLAEDLAGKAESHADEVRLLRRQIDIDRTACRAI